MSVVIFLVPLSIVLAGIFFAAYAWSVKSGQFDDLSTPSVRMLLDDEDNKIEEGRKP